MGVFGIIMIVYVGLLWLLVLSNQIDHWPPLAGRIAGFSLLALALFFQFVWFALIIEGWQLYWVAVPANLMKQQPVLEVIHWLLQLGRKTGWLLVGFTALIVLVRARHHPPLSRWLIHAAGWISTIALIGVLGEMHLLPALYPLPDPTIDGSQLWVPAWVLRIGLCLSLYGILLWLLTNMSNRFALQTVALLLVGSVVIGCGGAKNEPIATTALVEPTATAIPFPTFTATPVLAATPTQPAIPGQKMAYVRKEQLIITSYPHGEIYIADQCVQDEQPCTFSHLSWSTTGTHLAYFKRIFTPDGTNTTLYVLDEENQSHPVTTTTTPMLGFSPAWSPDGKSLAYLIDTKQIVQLPETAVSSTTGINSGNLMEIADMWVSHFPFTDPGERRGSIQVFTGFGGYPPTISEELYWQEGLSNGPAGPGLQLHWLPTDRLLFTRSPLRVGIGQFDLHSGQELEPLDPNELRQFAIHPLNQQLAAWTWDDQIAVGNTDGTMIMAHPIPGVTESRLTSPITGSVSAGAFFWGPTSGRLYFTTRTFVGSLAIDAGQYFEHYPDLPLFSAIPSAFDVYHTTLFVVNKGDFAQLQPLLASDDYGYGSLTEAANGDILFVRIENGIPLLEAMNAQLPPAEVMKHVPQASIMRLAASGGKVETLVENAGQLALTPPQ